MRLSRLLLSNAWVWRQLGDLGSILMLTKFIPLLPVYDLLNSDDEVGHSSSLMGALDSLPRAGDQITGVVRLQAPVVFNSLDVGVIIFGRSPLPPKTRCGDCFVSFSWSWWVSIWRGLRYVSPSTSPGPPVWIVNGWGNRLDVLVDRFWKQSRLC